jgi:hypothetical protein
MLIAVAALLFQFPVFSSYQIQAVEKPQPAALARAAEDSAVSSKSESSASSRKEILTAETRSPDAEGSAAFASGRPVAEPVAQPSPVAIEPTPVVVPVYRPVSYQRQRREWLALSIAAHGAAGFDAWSTRRVISSVPGAQEMNPFYRPFAGNASMYAAVQVAPTILDFLSHRMMNSRHEFFRHTWWLPQAVSVAVSVSSGVHNLGVYNSR